MALERFKLNKPKPIRDQVYDYLRQAVLNGHLQPGERVVETEIAEHFGISRMPVREALRKLEIEGLIETIPRKGNVVRKIEPDTVEEIFAIRQLLEPFVAKMAMERITAEEIESLKRSIERAEKAYQNGSREELLEQFREFNDTLSSASKMPLLVSILDNLKDHLIRFRTVTLSQEKRVAVAIEEHREILNAIIQKDEEGMQQLIKEHLEGARRLIYTQRELQ